MGTRTDADEPRTDDERGRMTTGMRWTVAAVAAIVVAGLAWAAWAATSGAPAPAASPTTTTQSSGAGARPSTGASPGATPVDGSEVIAPGPGQTDSARLPPLAQPTPVVTAPLPPDATAQGSVVTGLPTSVVGPAPGSDVVDSSIASDGSAMQATLIARTDRTPTEVEDHYRRVWSELGLAPTTADGVALAYADRYTSVTLAIRESGTGTLYTLYATLRTE